MASLPDRHRSRALKVGFGLQGDVKMLCESYPMWQHLLAVVEPVLPLELPSVWSDPAVCASAKLVRALQPAQSSLTAIVQAVGLVAVLFGVVTKQWRDVEVGVFGLMQTFGLPLDKRQQTSDWQVRPLSPAQVQYAALDARVLVEIFDRVFGDSSPAAITAICSRVAFSHSPGDAVAAAGAPLPLHAYEPLVVSSASPKAASGDRKQTRSVASSSKAGEASPTYLSSTTERQPPRPYHSDEPAVSATVGFVGAGGAVGASEAAAAGTAGTEGTSASSVASACAAGAAAGTCALPVRLNRPERSSHSGPVSEGDTSAASLPLGEDHFLSVLTTLGMQDRVVRVPEPLSSEGFADYFGVPIWRLVKSIGFFAAGRFWTTAACVYWPCSSCRGTCLLCGFCASIARPSSDH